MCKHSGSRLLVVLLTLSGFVVALAIGSSALAQAPPVHTPGTICYTPNFWCWAAPAGPPGSPCVCVTSYGPVGGVRG